MVSTVQNWRSRFEKLDNGGPGPKLSTVTLTAPGNGAAQTWESYRTCTVIAKASTIDTNAIYKMQGSHNGTDWVDIQDSAESFPVTVTDDGLAYYELLTPFHYVRPAFVSESGGTAGRLDFQFRFNP